MNIYGNKPVNLGVYGLEPKEMMFWLYCPVKLPGSLVGLAPDNLLWLYDICYASMTDAKEFRGVEWLKSAYVYITAKTLFVTPDNPGNRPGWHSDGFMTDDLNYVWSDKNPTLFWEPSERVEFTQDDSESLKEMQEVERCGPFKQYPDKTLLRLDQTVIHRVADVKTPCVRTFVKISISKNRYDLEGNSINHDLAPDWTYKKRADERNQPSSEEPKCSG